MTGKRPALAFMLLMTACSHPSVIRTSVEFGTKPPDLITITVRLKNQESRTTAELLIDVSVQLRRGEKWGKAASVMQPEPTVLNRNGKVTIEQPSIHAGKRAVLRVR